MKPDNSGAPGPVHIMVDLETMGSKPGSAIASIGAVVFDPVAGTLGDEFYRVVSLASCERAGLSFDAGTIMWWLGQSEAARSALGGGVELRGALAEFFWWIEHAAKGGRLRVWGHGGNFDEPLLSAASRAVSLPTPWRYSEGRCTRTLYELAGVELDRAAPEAGVHHNALDDARLQARAVCRAYANLGLATRPEGDAA